MMKILRSIGLVTAIWTVCFFVPRFLVAQDGNPIKTDAMPQSIVTFDAPGATLTLPFGINTAGTISGYYLDTQSEIHGFIRDSSGNITIVDSPEAAKGPGSATYTLGINDSGAVTGFFEPASDPSKFVGYVRDSSGSFTFFDVPGVAETFPLFLNNAGQSAGCFSEVGCGLYDVAAGGLIRDASGNLELFNVPGSINFAIQGMNNSGYTVGYYETADQAMHGFIRGSGGAITKFDAPGSATGTPYYGTFALGISDNGLVIGYYNDTNLVTHGFVRGGKQSFISFDVPGVGTTNTVPYEMNSAGASTGFYVDSTGAAAFVRSSSGSIRTFRVPGLTQTYATAINTAGQVTGYYIDANGKTHGFLKN